jgi:hypothetical protein
LLVKVGINYRFLEWLRLLIGGLRRTILLVRGSYALVQPTVGRLLLFTPDEGVRMHVKSIAVAITLSICVAGCGQGQKESPARAARQAKKAKPVLLAHRDRRAKKGKPVLQGLLDHRVHRGLRVLPDCLAQQAPPVKARCGSCAPTVRLQRAEASVTKTRF